MCGVWLSCTSYSEQLDTGHYCVEAQPRDVGPASPLSSKTSAQTSLQNHDSSSAPACGSVRSRSLEAATYQVVASPPDRADSPPLPCLRDLGRVHSVPKRPMTAALRTFVAGSPTADRPYHRDALEGQNNRGTAVTLVAGPPPTLCLQRRERSAAAWLVLYPVPSLVALQMADLQCSQTVR